MADLAVLRIQREFQEVMTSDEIMRSSIKIELVNDSWTELRGEIAGPPDTPYEGGKFVLDIKVPPNYPFSPPRVRFVTAIWHPNISSVTGNICLDLLKDNWVAAMSLRTMLLSVQVLLGSPEPDDPQDAVVGRQFKSNHQMFLLTAQHWTNACAGGPHSLPDFDAKIEQLKNMGVGEHFARSVLSKENWNLQTSTAWLFGTMANPTHT
ncbi:ubiquitin-conjugating enzyme E2-22 kDa-like [Drosophila guanche]|uniref:Blast:Ubiquitin-conjugating enzyme E2-22 kDa n=1 Tax=Drosophila guanche TaxID=7266 RepID=A0A3B0KIT7_DROGU|nr:ubiquitin-conjugating enzyme E2-22 kDa-like [Drosophila guanche]SPP86359.1 blast:Ubiquitin-conjugating enzyme E2-22 kDa [Drosophila guanche]